MPDQSLDILIRLLAETHGAEKVQDALNGVKTEAKAGGTALDETGKTAEKSFLHAESGGRAFHRLLHSISAESPVLGVALRLALDPTVGTLFALMGAMHAVKSAMAESAAAVKGFGEEMAKPFGETKEELFNVQQAVAASSEGFKTWEDKLKSHTANAVANLKSVYDALDKIYAGEEANALASAQGDKDEEARVKAHFADIKKGLGLENERAVMQAKAAELQKLQAEYAKQAEQARGMKGTPEEQQRAIDKLKEGVPKVILRKWGFIGEVVIFHSGLFF